MDDGTRALRALVDAVETVVVGKRLVVERCVLALAAGGHVLLEDVPGVGKTVLARALAAAVGAESSRVQGAPDLLPADITGSSVWDPGDGSFRFVPGPVFAGVVLVDELNRTTPRTQAALLEAMEEGQVTVDGVTRQLPEPHFVVATQNPAAHLGTYPLPESQLDRFHLRLRLGYPERGEEAQIVRSQLLRHPLADVEPVLQPAHVTALRQLVREVHVADEVLAHAVGLVRATRELAELGASPRAAVQLVRLAQARALLHGRRHVLPDDVKSLAQPALAHRVLGEDGTRAVAESLDRTAVPA